MAMVTWIGEVREKVDLWRSRWNCKDLTLPPMLYLRSMGDSAMVYDSRSGVMIEHEISNVGVQVLEGLTTPRRIGQLALDLGHIPGFDSGCEVALLEERGLIFREDDRVMSLVLPGKVSELRSLPGWNYLKAPVSVT